MIETNPIPIKYILNALGHCEATLRLPLCEPSSDATDAMRRMLDKIREMERADKSSA